MQMLDTTSPLFRRLALVSAALVALLIAVLSLLPGSALPHVPGTDKIKHMIAYAALAMPLAVWFGRGQWWRAVIVAVGYGLMLEAAQGLMSAGRTVSLLDAVANLAGAGLGAGLVRLTLLIRRGEG